MLGEGLDRLVPQGGVGEVLEDDVGRVGPGQGQGRSPRSPELDHQAEGVGAPPDHLDQAGGGDVAEVDGHGLGLVAGEQAVDVPRVHPEQDQRLVERQGPAQGVEDRPVELDQGQAVEPLGPERFEGQRAVIFEDPERRGGGRPRPAPG